MRMQPATIHLGPHNWQIRPLTLAQVQAIEPLLFGQREAGTVASAIAIVRVALDRDHPEAAGKLDLIEAGAPDIAEAMAMVLRLGGFLPDQTARAVKGEAQTMERGSG